MGTAPEPERFVHPRPVLCLPWLVLRALRTSTSEYLHQLGVLRGGYAAAISNHSCRNDNGDSCNGCQHHGGCQRVCRSKLASWRVGQDETRRRLLRRRRAVALDVVTLVLIRVSFRINVASSPAPLAFEASVVGPKVVVRVAVRGGSRALYVGPLHAPPRTSVGPRRRRPGALLERGGRGR